MRVTTILIIFLLLVPTSLAWDWSVAQSFDCEGCCVEDKTFQYSATITNTGADRFFLDSAELRKSSGSAIATWGSNDGSGYYLDSSETKEITLTGNIPRPDGNQVSYYVCFYLSEERENWFGGTTTYEDWSCSPVQSKQVTTKENFACFTDSNCANDQYCSITTSCTSSCKSVQQGTCGHVVDHKWANYECCSDSGCPSTKSCESNHCIAIPCECGYVSNHQCIKYECCSNDVCATDKQCINHECETPNCGSCSYVVNHQCKKYECCSDNGCNSNENCVNHECQKLNCKYSEYVGSHGCVKHDCMSNEDCSLDKECKNNKCVTPTCKDDEVIKYHSCKELSFTILGYVKDNRYVSHFSKEGYNDHRAYYFIFGGVFLLILLAIGGFFVFKMIKDRKKEKKPIKKKVIKEKKKLDVCSKCKKAVDKKDKFCMHCGQGIKEVVKKEETLEEHKEEIKEHKFCKKCGNKVSKSKKFCSKCGSSVK